MLVMTSRNCIESSRGDHNYRTAPLPTIPSRYNRRCLRKQRLEKIFSSMPLSLFSPFFFSILLSSIPVLQRGEWKRGQVSRDCVTPIIRARTAINHGPR